MDRRQFVTVVVSAATVSIAGCTDSDAIVSGSTNFEETWEVDLEEGDELELEVTLDDGLFANGTVSRNDNADSVAIIEMEEEGTITEQFTAPATVDYFVVLQVSEDGRASLSLRHIND